MSRIQRRYGHLDPVSKAHLYPDASIVCGKWEVHGFKRTQVTNPKLIVEILTYPEFMPLPGGSADKLGNRYELWWTVIQLERMLQGITDSIRIEDPGVDKSEFVLLVHGHRELHQSKRSHPSGKWSIAALVAEKVLPAIYEQLRGNSDEFLFVSESHAGELAELVHRAHSAATPEEFQSKFLGANDVLENFERLVKAWQGCDTKTAWGVLRRIQIRSIDEKSLSERAQAEARVLFLADPHEVCSTLRTIALDSVHQTVSREDLVELLKARGLVLRRLVIGANASAVVAEATNRYLESTVPRLINQMLLPRTATGALLSKLGTNAGDSVLTGRAGTGKTGCIIEFVQQLRARAIPVLAVRLDRINPVSTPTDLGTELGFEESPALILAEAAGGKEAVLVVDQLDAVSTTSGRASSFLEAVEGLLIEARGLRCRLQLHVVVCCREFDWKNDHRLRAILPQSYTEVPVAEFALSEVTDTLLKAGFNTETFHIRQLELLRLPQNLSLFLESRFDPTQPLLFNTAKELFDRYWDRKREAVNLRAGNVGDFWIVIVSVLVEEMAVTQQLSVLAEKLDTVHPGYLKQMASEGVVSFDGQRYAFGHESFFDYCFARSFVREGQSLVALLISSEQHLFRRAQVRQVLTYLRDADRERYLRELQDLVSNPAIRPHLKSVAIALLADVPDPTNEEWAVWQHLLDPYFEALSEDRNSTNKLANMSANSFFSSSSWFRYVCDQGVIANWLSTGGRLADAATQYLRMHQRHSPDSVVKLLEPYVGAGGGWPARLAHIVQWSDQVSSRSYFEFVLRLIADGILDEARAPIAVNSTFWSMFYQLGKERPDWIPELLTCWLKRRIAVSKAQGTTLKDDLGLDGDQFADKPIGEGAKNAPSRFVEHVLPLVLNISDIATDSLQQPPKRDGVWPVEVKCAPTTRVTVAIVEGLKSSLSLLARDLEVDLSSTISELRRRETYLANSLLLSLYAANGARFANDAAALLAAQPWRFKCGFVDSSYWIAKEAIGAIAPYCTEENRISLEKAILNYSPAFENSPSGFRLAGQATFTLLSAISKDLRTASANARFLELERKFGKPDVAPRGISGGWVSSPIEPKAASKMTDEQWLGAIARYATEERKFRTADELLKGGSLELARELQKFAEQEAARFARLALRFPVGTNAVYHEHVLYALKKAAISSDLKLEVCRKAFADCREASGSAIAQVIGSIEDPLPDDAIAMLGWIATEHPEPHEEDWQAQSANGNAFYDGDIYTNGINTTRGQAVEAIGNLILRHFSYLDRFGASLERMIQDPSAAVRSCVGFALRAIAQHDLVLGLSFLLRMNVGEDQLLATPHIGRLIRATLPKHFKEVRQILERMIRSQVPEVAENGAQLAALGCLYHPEAAELEAAAFAASDRHRLGIARVASANICSTDSRAWCESRLVSMFNDKSEAVRREAAMCFRYLEGAALEEYADLIAAFCEGEAYQDDSFSILHTLTQSRQRLPGVTCAVCEKFLDRFSDEARDIRTSRIGDAHFAIELVFRTYQQHRQDEWTARTLDLIDRLCLEGIHGLDDGFRDFER